MILIRSTPEFSSFFPSSYFSVVNRNEEGEGTPANETPVHTIRNVQVFEHEDNFNLTMDLPGVKENDVKITEEDFFLTIEAVRKANDKEVCKFFFKFTLDKKSVKPEGIKANLADGVLTVTIPKTPAPKTFEITPSAFDPPAEAEGGTFFRVDMPGVKLEDLKVSVTGDELFISAERKKGTTTSVFKRFFTVDEKVDTEKLAAFFSDGVLTLTAPMKAGFEAETAVTVRTFPVNKTAIEQEK
jgi:HSP20 family protein